MAVLITGLGYIGTALARRLLDDGEHVVGLENWFSTVPAVVRSLARHERFTLIRGSVNSQRSLERAFAEGPVSTVYHLAAQASAHPDAATPAYTEATNLIAPRHLFAAAVRHDAGRMIYASSFKLYGDDLSGTIDESRPYGQIGDLAHVTKLYAEKLFEMLAARDRLPVANVRLGIVYGLGPLMKTDQRFLTVPNLFCLRATLGQPLVVHPGAKCPMGFIHLDDAVEALVLAGEVLAEPNAGAFNATSEALTVGEVAGLVSSLATERGLMVRVAGAAPATLERWTVASRLDRYGYSPRRAMRESLAPVLDYYVQCRKGSG